MSLRIHCDQCDAFIWQTKPGQWFVPWAPNMLGDNRFFCSKECYKAWGATEDMLSRSERKRRMTA